MNGTQDSTSFMDPVCGMKVTPESAAGTAEFRGTTYYFCSTHCQRKFEADPSAFIHPEERSAAEQAESCCGPTAKQIPAPVASPSHAQHTHSLAETERAAAERKPAK